MCGRPYPCHLIVLVTLEVNIHVVFLPTVVLHEYLNLNSIVNSLFNSAERIVFVIDAIIIELDLNWNIISSIIKLSEKQYCRLLWPLSAR